MDTQRGVVISRKLIFNKLADLIQALATDPDDTLYSDLCAVVAAFEEGRPDSDVDEKLGALYWFLLDQINGMHWRDVPAISRNAFAAVSVALCSVALSREHVTNAELQDIYRVADIGLLLGSEYAYADLQNILQELDKRREMLPVPLADGITTATVGNGPGFSSETRQAYVRALNHEATIVHRKPVARKVAPSLNEFMRDHLSISEPCVLTGCVDHWPAAAEGSGRRWSDLDYIQRGKNLELCNAFRYLISQVYCVCSFMRA
jgi:hypothetical protein